MQRVLHRLVLEHFETFRARAASLRDGEGLPRFVEQFRDLLGCNISLASRTLLSIRCVIDGEMLMRTQGTRKQTPKAKSLRVRKLTVKDLTPRQADTIKGGMKTRLNGTCTCGDIG